MSSTVIRDFLVALTFKTDDSGAKKSKDALDSNEKSAKLLSRALIALASTAVIAVAKTANELEKLYYSSQRIGASANNIRAYGDAISQMGGSAEGALSSLESVARKLRESPGYEGMLKGLGVNTRDQNGQMRDRVEVMKDLSKTLQGMEYYKANAYAGALGIDETTLMAMRDGKFTSEMDKYQKLRKSMGLNDDLAKSGQEFAYQWRDMMMQLKALMEVILMTAGKALIPVLKLLNQLIQFIIHWFGQLDPQLKSFLATGLKIALLTVVFGGLFSAVAKFAKLLPMLTGLLNVFKALRLVFLASPIGIVLALAAAIALLWDDYQTWKNGGESLIDWSKWSKGLDKAIESIKTLSEKLKNLAKAWMEFAKGAYDKAVDWTSRNIIEPVANAIANPEQAKQQVTDAVQQAGAAAVKAVVDTVNSVKDDVQEKAQANAGIKHLGWLSAKYEGKIDSANKDVDQNGDPAGWAYGKYQFNSAKGGLQKFFADNPEIAKQFDGIKPETKAFSKKWKELAKNDPSGFEVAQDKSAANLWYKPAAKAYSNAGFNLDNEGVREAVFSSSIQHGGVIRKLLPLIQKIAGKDISQLSAKEQVELIYQARKKYYPNGSGRYNDELKSALSVVDNTASQRNQVAWNVANLNKDALARMAQNATIPGSNQFVVPQNSNAQTLSKNVNINQKTDIHVTGGDAPMTAKAVRKEQDAVNLQMSRNAAGLFG
ncbi:MULTISPECIES: phage tail tape measure protein [unclassified Acinetobacter]|uniref:phage tail tape measure protein n=1 Tax=unclassified Acinetobacter TaxID=196816 RepID=UPI00244712E9|nr:MULTISPECIES: phage tail tape measure protein [unclassified Acinetobacter]MDH0030314.1 phage tail tape measure protein [Acinetobacter sp. GD04021]MDH0885882.1 phage tail tape measure protein [Acinetobacter sp. GD03873]MDH1082502.1 phage tail tape measure protein [Acinetobacter sp. GD03983]MDH2189106.1 phage tail tape measure protein [Acinetobacter sp. GD03645]MDH2202294.1 phage tail tape measure protein [Acinetobacter sp. GD03647]